jgi:hypothetical protein
MLPPLNDGAEAVALPRGALIIAVRHHIPGPASNRAHKTAAEATQGARFVQMPTSHNCHFGGTHLCGPDTSLF